MRPTRFIKSKFDQFECTLNSLYKENEFLKRYIKRMFNKLNDLEFKVKYCPSFGGKNECYLLNSKIIDNTEGENNRIRGRDDLGMVTSAELNEKPAIVDSGVQRSDDTNHIQLAHTNSEDNIEYESTPMTKPINLELGFAYLDTSEDDVTTCTTIEQSQGQVITELNDHSQLSTAHEQEEIDTIKSTDICNYIEKNNYNKQTNVMD
jgi:hypothetical protein